MDDQNLTDNFFKGEAVEITLLAKNVDGTPLTDANDAIVIMTIGLSPSGEPLLQFDDKHTLLDLPTARFNITLSALDVTLLTEGKAYYYNMWTQALTGDPRLQGKGKISLNKSIEPT